MNDFYKFSCLSIAGRNAINMNDMEYLRNIMGIYEKTIKSTEKNKNPKEIC